MLEMFTDEKLAMTQSGRILRTMPEKKVASRMRVGRADGQLRVRGLPVPSASSGRPP